MNARFIAVYIIFFLLCANVSLYSQNESIELSGDILQYALPAAAAVSTIYVKDGSKPALQLTKSIVGSFVVTHSLKRIVDKERPNGGSHAFPSGHTSAAFVGAAFIERRYGWKWGIPSYLLASYVGWSRVDALKHDWVDVGFGAALGICTAYIFTKPYQVGNATVQIDVSAGFLHATISF